MKTLVLDCSVSASWLFAGEAQEAYAESVMSALADHRTHVPCIWPGEMANVARQGVRSGRRTREDAMQRLAIVEQFPITVETQMPDPTALLSAALDWGLTPYDASYLLLAQRLKASLATWDKAMRSAAAKLGIPVFAPIS